jgi:hypothetical protein
MKISILFLARGVALASPVAAPASENPYGRVHGHRTTHRAIAVSTWHDPFNPAEPTG